MSFSNPNYSVFTFFYYEKHKFKKSGLNYFFLVNRFTKKVWKEGYNELNGYYYRNSNHNTNIFNNLKNEKNR